MTATRPPATPRIFLTLMTFPHPTARADLDAKADKLQNDVQNVSALATADMIVPATV